MYNSGSRERATRTKQIVIPTKQTRSILASARPALLGATAVFLALLGIVTLAVKLWRLVGDPGPLGAIDIKILYFLTRSWFEGIPIYERLAEGVTYPPASFAILWPAYGWLTLDRARVLWAIVDLAALVALSGLFWRAVRFGGRLAQLCAALAPFSMPALADALGIGQLTIVVLPLAVGAVLLAARENPVWRRDIVAAAMFVCALVKPSLVAPFFIPLLIVPRRARPAALVIVGYGLLTWLASRFQPGSLPTQLRGWRKHVAGNSGAGYGNVQDWLAQLGWPNVFPVVSLLLLAGLAIFTWRYRRIDVWLLLGVAAIVARLWTYHRVYDDGLLIVAMIALARLAAEPQAVPWVVWSVRVTLITSAIVLWIPLQFHYVGSTFGPLLVMPSWVTLFNVAHAAVFVLTLIVLIAAGRASATPPAQ